MQSLFLPVPDGRLDLAQTLDCGQAFRWAQVEEGVFEGVAGCGFARMRRLPEGVELLTDLPDAAFWQRYLDLSRDYAALTARFSRNPALRRAVAFAPGLRLLRQDGWEALCTFILSQNNHIPRIKGIVARLCEQFGPKTPSGRAGFPGPEALAGRPVEELAGLRSGFRAAYLLGAANRVCSGALELSALETLPLEEARRQLTAIRGVGPKVADCALLYGFGRVEAFPVDVWIGRVMEALFPGGLPKYLQREAGLAQQYLFHYARSRPELLAPRRAATQKAAAGTKG